ncbi:hypothetical protein AAFF_G00083560 [Aldrovandia affinis]|uniref:Uncharacterized protein n=1 Tax=Aldrovandia affinis TaxID=143900 RepID=A0AAD7R1G8_9TELE|nr:hypothetical protein AAFF_G00083560 [Aldrovandia affinis]
MVVRKGVGNGEGVVMWLHSCDTPAMRCACSSGTSLPSQERARARAHNIGSSEKPAVCACAPLRKTRPSDHAPRCPRAEPREIRISSALPIGCF